MAGALEVINNDPNVQVDLHQHLRRHHQGRRGRQRHRRRRSAGSTIDAPIVIRLDGTNAEEGRAILEPHLSDKLQIASPPCSKRPSAAVELARRERADVSIFVDENTKVVYQGLTGCAGPLLRPAQPGLRHAGRRPAPTRRRPAPTSTASRSSPSVADAVAGHRRHRVVHLHPRPGRAGRGAWRRPRAASSSSSCITEGVPAQDEAWFFNKLKRDFPARAAARPELPRHHQPRQVQHRHHRRRDRQGGRPGRHREPLRHAHLPGALRAASRRTSASPPASASAATRCRAQLHRLPRARSRPTPRPRP